MFDTQSMLAASPGTLGFQADQLTKCIDSCFGCAQTCAACADACLGEDMVAELRRCITLNSNCSDICAATGRVLSRQTDYDADMTRAALTACAEACRLCAAECEKHQKMQHCQICAAACKRCEVACRELLKT